MSRFLEKLAVSVAGRVAKAVLDKILKPKSPKESQPGVPPIKSHPWRTCPRGEHWVRVHPMTVPESSKGPKRETVRQGHCRRNPSGKEVCNADEMRDIAFRCFKDLPVEAMPAPDPLGYPDGNKYDLSIAGWTRFWNDIFRPTTPLDPDFVKALIATESSFKTPPDVTSKDGPARGLIQITEKTRRILLNPKGELRDYLIEASKEEIRDPEVNLGAGVRWLHHKRELARHRLKLKREATWEEAVAEYKGILPDLGKGGKPDKIMEDIRTLYGRLKRWRQGSSHQ